MLFFKSKQDSNVLFCFFLFWGLQNASLLPVIIKMKPKTKPKVCFIIWKHNSNHIHMNIAEFKDHLIWLLQCQMLDCRLPSLPSSWTGEVFVNNSEKFLQKFSFFNFLQRGSANCRLPGSIQFTANKIILDEKENNWLHWFMSPYLPKGKIICLHSHWSYGLSVRLLLWKVNSNPAAFKFFR